MANTCSTVVMMYGTREALTSALLLLSQGLDHEFGELPEGAYVKALFDSDELPPTTAGLPSMAPPPLHRPRYLVPNLLVPAPLRFQGDGPTGWWAPRVNASWAFRVSALSARQLPAMLEPGDGEDGRSPVMQLTLRMSSKWSPPLDLLKACSTRVPGVVLECRYDEAGNDILGAVAYHRGAKLAQLDCPNTVTREECGLAEDDDSDEASDAVYQKHLDISDEQMRDQVKQPAQHAALTRLPRTRSWAELTSQAHNQGVQGIEAALADLPSANGKAVALATDIADARRQGGPSWMDACLFASAEVEALFERAQLAAESDSESDGDTVLSEQSPVFFTTANPQRALDLLRVCATESTLSDALVHVLSEPGARLMSRLHPVCILADAAKEYASGEVHEGVRRLTDAMRAKLQPLPEASLVGREFLACNESDSGSQDAINNLVAHMLLTSGDEGVERAGKLFGPAVTTPRGPRLNPNYTFSAEADALLRSLLHCGLQGSVPGAQLALQAGFDEEFLFRSLAHVHPAGAMRAFVAIKGGAGALTPTMQACLLRECEAHKDQRTAAQFQAQLTAERMSDIIRDRLSSTAETVEPPRRHPRARL